jgi:hypothetical protein
VTIIEIMDNSMRRKDSISLNFLHSKNLNKSPMKRKPVPKFEPAPVESKSEDLLRDGNQSQASLASSVSGRNRNTSHCSIPILAAADSNKRSSSRNSPQKSLVSSGLTDSEIDCILEEMLVILRS